MLKALDLYLERSASFRLDIPSFEAPAHTIVCVAGPNGSGKTTFIECLTGLVQPTRGAVTIADQPVGKDLRTIRARIGFIPDDEAWFVPELTAREYIRLLHNVYTAAGVKADMPSRVELLAKALYFTAFDQQLSSLSHGNKKKIQIIAGLMHEPAVIIADEIRNGLDPLAIIASEHLLRNEAERGAIVIGATHDLWWAERIADAVLLLVDGKPAVQDTTAAIVRNHGSIEALFMDVMQRHMDNAAL